MRSILKHSYIKGVFGFRYVSDSRIRYEDADADSSSQSRSSSSRVLSCLGELHDFY